jgi:ABC-type bacteriocin/lantibiotic exporter with double-glycine peptidase domain
MILLITGFFVHVARTIGSPESKLQSKIWFRGGEYLDSSGVVLQKSSNDCGAAALKMVFDHYNMIRPLNDWTEELIDRPEGTSMLRLKEVAEKWGLRADGWRISIQDLETIPLPSIALMTRSHYVVIESIQDSENLVYVDPSIGRMRINKSQFLSKTHGEMLLIRKE